ncbi:hypothetical protein [Lysobacter capsici]|uniref:hypothetical protein n=1 Tax=Lysobacter capsici TaxID=435897 RepID=UPI00287BBCF7|nr:hypothetical protein [Lysobacter capsici]WND80514.1 hypothetical protein RJ610_25095 [Lysobacter capsici]WND85711.1 hypothetical protein RJ609_25115 [Lysobacter capsici]
MVRPDLASLLKWRSSIVSASDVSLREAKFIMQAPTLGYCHYRPPKKIKSPAAGIDRFNLGGRQGAARASSLGCYVSAQYDRRTLQ